MFVNPLSKESCPTPIHLRNPGSATKKCCKIWKLDKYLKHVQDKFRIVLLKNICLKTTFCFLSQERGRPTKDPRIDSSFTITVERYNYKPFLLQVVQIYEERLIRYQISLAKIHPCYCLRPPVQASEMPFSQETHQNTTILRAELSQGPGARANLPCAPLVPDEPKATPRRSSRKRVSETEATLK